jgi:hypothetical protein
MLDVKTTNRSFSNLEIVDVWTYSLDLGQVYMQFQYASNHIELNAMAKQYWSRFASDCSFLGIPIDGVYE